MKTFATAIAFMTAAFPLTAGISSLWAGGPTVMIAVPQPRSVAVSLTMPADFVSVPVRIISDQKNSALAYEETRQAIEFIARKAKENGSLRATTRAVSLTQHRSEFGISGGSWSQPAAAVVIYLLVPFTKEHDDIFTAGAEAARFIDALHLPGKVHCELGQLELAVENPEQYRPRLLAAIAEEVKKTCETMASQGSSRLEGLENSVMVRQADDRNVELFVKYSLTITVEK